MLSENLSFRVLPYIIGKNGYFLKPYSVDLSKNFKVFKSAGEAAAYETA